MLACRLRCTCLLPRLETLDLKKRRETLWQEEEWDRKLPVDWCELDMGRERLKLLLRLGALLTAVCVCVHVYLETGWRDAPPAPPARGRPTQSTLNSGQHSRTKRLSAKAEERDRSVKRRISYVRSLKKDRTDGAREDPSPPCCPPIRPHRKVRLIAAIKILVKLSEAKSVQQESERLNEEPSLFCCEPPA